MKQARAAVWFLLASLWAGCALAQAIPNESAEALRALRIYRITTQRMLSICSDLVVERQSRARQPAAANYRSCVSRAAAASNARFEEAVRSLAAAESLQALREYHAAFERALAGIEPRAGEPDGAYDERQGFLFHRLAHAWARFELAETVAQ